MTEKVSEVKMVQGEPDQALKQILEDICACPACRINVAFNLLLMLLQTIADEGEEGEQIAQVLANRFTNNWQITHANGDPSAQVDFHTGKPRSEEAEEEEGCSNTFH